MERVRGIGGVFFKARDPKRLAAWYREQLGVAIEDWGGGRFVWREHDPRGDAYTVLSFFAEDSTYFAPSQARFMINFRVDDLDGMLAQLRAGGADVADRIEDSEFGRFGWVLDPEGNKVELWQPPA